MSVSKARAYMSVAPLRYTIIGLAPGAVHKI
jgi:hypothetical protein